MIEFKNVSGDKKEPPFEVSFTIKPIDKNAIIEIQRINPFEKNVGYSPIWKTPSSGTYLLKVNVKKTELQNLAKGIIYIADLKLERFGEGLCYSAKLINMVQENSE